MMDFKLADKIYFFITLPIFKVLAPFQTRKGKLAILISELLWFFRPFVHFKPDMKVPFCDGYIETARGKFYVNPDLQSLITVSPAFETMDISYAEKLIEAELKKRKKVLFIDVGAHIGLYSVAISRKCKNNSNLYIKAFEPNANNFYMDDFLLLEKNIKKNHVKNAKLYKIGLGSRNTTKKNKFGIQTKPLDSLISKSELSKFDTIFVKIDIEGFEVDALKGSSNVMKADCDVFILTEDCVDRRVVTYLKQNKFKQITKRTSYNSFWVNKNDYRY